MKTQHPSSCRGFSLIELLIVAAIIGLIAAIAIPNLVNAIQRGRQARTVGDARGLATSVAMYQQDYAKYPIVQGPCVMRRALRPHISCRTWPTLAHWMVGKDRCSTRVTAITTLWSRTRSMALPDTSVGTGPDELLRR